MIIKSELHAEINDILKDYSSRPTDKRFHDEIKFGPRNAYSILLWAPIEQYSCDVKCPLHPGNNLKLLKLTDNLEKSARNDNPRYSCMFYRYLLSNDLNDFRH